MSPSTDTKQERATMAATETTKETKKNNDKPAAAETSKPAATGAPAGYLKAATDAVGFFDGDLQKPIHFVPLHVVLNDSSVEPIKPSALIFGRLVDPCEAIRSAEGEGEVSARPLIETKRGDVVGIWFSAGMSALATLGGAIVYMYQEPESKWKKIKNKPSKMKTYDIANDPKRPGTALKVLQDRRKESAGVEAKPFAGRKLAGAADTVDTGDAGGNDDDIPF